MASPKLRASWASNRRRVVHASWNEPRMVGGVRRYEEETKVWRTQDGGQNWENRSAGLPNLPIHCLLELADGTWLCGSDLGVHVWSDASQSWSAFGEGLPLTPVTDLQEDLILNRIVAGTYGRGAWSTPLPSAPDWALAPVGLDASPAQCFNEIAGHVILHNAGQAPVDECALEITLSQGTDQITTWESLNLAEPLEPGQSVETPELLFSSPFWAKSKSPSKSMPSTVRLQARRGHPRCGRPGCPKRRC